MTQGQNRLREADGIVGSAWSMLTKIFGSASRSWQYGPARTPLYASRDLPPFPRLIYSTRTPMPMSDEEIAQLAATLPRRLPRGSTGSLSWTLHGEGNISSLPNRANAGETEQALSEALARLRQLTKRGGH